MPACCFWLSRSWASASGTCAPWTGYRGEADVNVEYLVNGAIALGLLLYLGYALLKPERL